MDENSSDRTPDISSDSSGLPASEPIPPEPIPAEQFPPALPAPSWWRRLLHVLLNWLPFFVWAALMYSMLFAKRFPYGDSPHVLGICMRLASFLRGLEFEEFFFRWLSLVAPHPPGAYVVPTLLYTFLGARWYVPYLASAFFLILGWDAVLRMLRAMGARGGWGVALMLAATPLFWSQSELYGIDLVSAAIAAQTLSHLMASRGLAILKHAILAGIWLGLGFWVKYTFPIFLAAPCAAVIVGMLWDLIRHRPGLARRAMNGIWLSTALLLTILTLLAHRGREIYLYVLSSIHPTEEQRLLIDALAQKKVVVIGLEQKLHYVASLKDLWGWPGLTLLAIGLTVFVAEAVHRRYKHAYTDQQALELRAAVQCLLCAVAGTFILSNLAQRQDRYMLPMLIPLVAVLVPPLSSRWLGAPLVLAALLPTLFYVFADFAGFTHSLQFDQGVRSVSVKWKRHREAPFARKMDLMPLESLSTWGRYPLLEERYRPMSGRAGRWQVDTILEAAARAMQSDMGNLGIYFEQGGLVPEFGIFFLRAEQLGYHWKFLTLKLHPGTPDPGKSTGLSVSLFQAPFVDDETPEFHVLVIVADPDDTLIERYLEGFQHREVERIEQSHGTVRVVMLEGRKG